MAMSGFFLTKSSQIAALAHVQLKCGENRRNVATLVVLRETHVAENDAIADVGPKIEILSPSLFIRYGIFTCAQKLTAGLG